MDLIQIDEIHAQPAQRIVAAFDDVLAAEPLLVGLLPIAPHTLVATMISSRDAISLRYSPVISSLKPAE
jgi:hypothetical protein